VGLQVITQEPYETGQRAACGSRAACWPPLQYADWRATGKNTLQVLVTSQKNGMAPYSQHRGKEQGTVLSLLGILSHDWNFGPFLEIFVKV